MRLPDLREEIAQCKRQGQMHDACMVRYVDLIPRGSVVPDYCADRLPISSEACVPKKIAVHARTTATKVSITLRVSSSTGAPHCASRSGIIGASPIEFLKWTKVQRTDRRKKNHNRLRR
jgi:hypothetical protein